MCNIIHLGSAIQPACQFGGFNSNKARPTADRALQVSHQGCSWPEHGHQQHLAVVQVVAEKN